MTDTTIPDLPESIEGTTLWQSPHIVPATITAKTMEPPASVSYDLPDLFRMIAERYNTEAIEYNSMRDSLSGVSAKNIELNNEVIDYKERLEAAQALNVALQAKVTELEERPAIDEEHAKAFEDMNAALERAEAKIKEWEQYGKTIHAKSMELVALKEETELISASNLEKLMRRNEEIELLGEEIGTLTAKLNTANTHAKRVPSLEKRLEKKEGELSAALSRIESLKETISDRNKQIGKLNTAANQHNTTVTQKDRHIEDLQDRFAKKEKAHSKEISIIALEKDDAMNKVIIEKANVARLDDLRERQFQKIKRMVMLMHKMRHVLILEGHIPDKEMVINNNRYYIFKRPANVKKAWSHLDDKGYEVSSEHNYYYYVESTTGVHRDIIPLTDGNVISAKATALPKEVKDWTLQAFKDTKLHIDKPEMRQPRYCEEGTLGGLMEEIDIELFGDDEEMRLERIRLHQESIIDPERAVQCAL